MILAIVEKAKTYLKDISQALNIDIGQGTEKKWPLRQFWEHVLINAHILASPWFPLHLYVLAGANEKPSLLTGGTGLAFNSLTRIVENWLQGKFGR